MTSGVSELRETLRDLEDRHADAALRFKVEDRLRDALMVELATGREPLFVAMTGAATEEDRRARRLELRAFDAPRLADIRKYAREWRNRFQHPDPQVQEAVLAAIQLEAVSSAEGHLASPRDAHEIAYRAAGMAASDEWCGFFAMENYVQSNLDSDLKRGFFHVINVEDYFTYHYAFGPRKDTRVMKWIYADGAWHDLREYHTQRGSPRKWLTADQLGENPDIRSGDLVLIDNRDTPAADHIVMAHSYDMTTNTLFTIGGNDGGYEVDTGAHHTTPHGAERLEGATGQKLRGASSGYRVGVNEIDLNRNRQPLRVYGIGRPSIVDFEEHRYDSTNERHPPSGG